MIILKCLKHLEKKWKCEKRGISNNYYIVLRLQTNMATCLNPSSSVSFLVVFHPITDSTSEIWWGRAIPYHSSFFLLLTKGITSFWICFQKSLVYILINIRHPYTSVLHSFLFSLVLRRKNTSQAVTSLADLLFVWHWNRRYTFARQEKRSSFEGNLRWNAY